MSTHRVICNEGFVSEPMTALKAHRHARTLESLGNYSVYVMTNKQAAHYRLHMRGGLL